MLLFWEKLNIYSGPKMDAETSAYYRVFLNMVCQATQTAANSQDLSKPPYLAPACSLWNPAQESFKGS